MNESQWRRVTELFDRLLAGHDPDISLAGERDPEVFAAARNLWEHHLRADEENYLSAPMEFEVTTVFQPGDVLLNRFRIEALLGAGGMGEVYLASDERLADRVALKTMPRLLAPSASLRRRFMAEVQSARRVTHPNVCRIHELFEDGANVFFSMEYLEGVLLSDLLDGHIDNALAGAITRQMAAALHTAHQAGVVHGDFKPSNIMILAGDGREPRAVIMDFGLARALDRAAGLAGDNLSVRAGTIDYMAPELHSGGQPTVRSDIFAFGKVAAQLLPGQRHLWEECIAPLPESRPVSLDSIVSRLEPGATRRYWIVGSLVAAAGGIGYGLWPRRQIRIEVPADARVLVNGFGAPADQISPARLARSVILTSLGQSARIHAISDADLFPVLRGRGPKGSLPLAGSVRDEVLQQLKAAFWIDGDLRKAGERYSLDVRLMAVNGQQPVAESAFRDGPNALALGEAVALWLRRAIGESPQSLAVNPAEVSSYTSSVPEALQKYYDAMEHFAVADMGQAVPLLREAIRLDPNFAQAHAMLAMTLNPSQYDEAFEEIRIAFNLSPRLPPRERTGIEANYYHLTGDPLKLLEIARSQAADLADEPRLQIQLGQALGSAGYLGEAVAAFRKAVELAPNDWMTIQRLEAGLVQDGKYEEALAVFRAARARGVAGWIYNGAGSAWMGLDRYAEAIQAFERQPSNAENTADIQAAKIMQGHLEIAVAAMEEKRALPEGPRDAFQTAEFLCGLYFALDRRASAMEHARAMSSLPVYPIKAEEFACAGSWARRVAEPEALARVCDGAAQLSRRWPNARTRAVEMHTSALRLWSQNALEEAESLLLKSSGAAFSMWALFDLAEFFTERGKWELAEEYWQKFEAQRGTVIVKGWYPGIIVMGWLQRAFAAQASGRREVAWRSAQKVLDHWSRSNPRVQIVQLAEKINFVTKTT